jgi:hypothetical protein
MNQNNEVKLDFSALDKITVPEVDSIEAFENKVDAEEIKEDVLDEMGEIPEEEFDPNDTPEDLANDTHLNEPNTEANTGEGQDEDALRELAKWGHELGIFDYDEDKFESSEDYFKEQFFDKVKKEALQAVPDEFKQIMNAYMQGVPLNELLNSKAREESFAQLSEDELSADDGLQEDLVKQWLSLQDYEADEIDEKIESYKEGLLLEKEAKTALKKLKKYESTYQQRLAQEAEMQRKAQEEQYTAVINDLKNTIQSAETFIPGVSMGSNEKEKLFAALTKRDREGRTELEKKMSSKEMQLAVAQFVMQLEGKVDAVERKALTKAAKQTKETVNSGTTPKTKTSVDLGVIRQALKKSKQQYKF